ncbi:hypothetical protein AAV94_02500 [Lampropedia cohaerens]|uniref:DUF1631 domain-containing protein n=1 Tax=Lampropedia cohaerens TaxID=1610491 RepID=A0A0U1Q252_9BURK|nr:DUF1631 family protein [Lampropedia cohaerens]KKW68830.1 hypothetical protein AAV94_02500 [Lampropedia cohaerens]
MDDADSNWQHFQQAVVAALREGGALARRALRDTGVRLAQRQDVAVAAEATPAQQALRMLDQHHDDWVRRYPAYLLEAFAEMVAFDPCTQDDGLASGLGDFGYSEELSIQAKSEIMHACRTLEAAVERPLAQLDGLISGARGYAYSRRSRNPLRPDNYLLAAQQLVYQSATGVAEVVNVLFLKTFAAALAPALVRSYGFIVQQLSEAGVAAVPKRQTGFGGLTTGFGHMALLGAEAGVQAEQILTRDALLVALGADAPGYRIAEPGADVAQHAGAPAAARALALPPATETISLQTLLVRTAKVVEKASPLKEVLALMQPALRQLVQSDPAFLRQAAHPARQFLAALVDCATRAQTLPAPQAQALIAGIRQVVRDVAGGDAADVRPFEQGLTLLRTAYASFSPSPVRARDTIAPADLLAAVTAHIHAEPAYAAAHPRVQTFVAGPWARVVARSLLRHAHATEHAFNSVDALIAEDPQGYLQLVPLLLLSVQAGSLGQDAQRLRAIKAMHGVIAKGLAEAGIPRGKVESAVSKLKELHRQALQQAMADGRGGTDGVQAASSLDAGHQPAPLQVPHLTVDVTVPEGRQGGVQRYTGDALPKLEVGRWYLLGGADMPQRTQLSWASPDKSMFMFTSSDGQNQTLTLRRVQQLVNNAQLKCVE